MNISASIKFTIHAATTPAMQDVFNANEAQILKLARADRLVLSDTLDAPRASAKAVTDEASIAVPLEGLIDFAKERERLRNQIEKITEERDRLVTQLSNKNFVERAPAEKVETLRLRSDELSQQIETLSANLASLE